MRWSAYGLILSVKNFTDKYKLIGILTDHGYWKGLHLIKNGSVSSFSQAYCTWEGKNPDAVGYWELSKIMHLPYKHSYRQFTDFHAHSHQTFLTYCASLYIANLAIILFPERVPSKQNFETLLIVKEFLSNNQWLEAWLVFEELISESKIFELSEDLNPNKNIKVEDNIQTELKLKPSLNVSKLQISVFLENVSDYIKNLYQIDINNHLRKILIKHT